MEYTFQEMPDVHGTGERKVYPKATHCSRIGNDYFIKGLAERTSYGKGTIEGIVQEQTDELNSYMKIGHSVKVDGLGTFNIALGMKEGHATEEVKEEGELYDTYGVYIKTINFIPDPKWLRRLRQSIDLYKVGKVKTLHKNRTTLDERRQQVLRYLDEHPFITVSDYMQLASVPHTRACQELRQFASDPASGIGSSGVRSHKVYVKRTATEDDAAATQP